MWNLCYSRDTVVPLTHYGMFVEWKCVDLSLFLYVTVPCEAHKGT